MAENRRPPVERQTVPIPTSGAVGMAPPPGAPREIAAPIGDGDGAVLVGGQLITPQQLARQNERELAPLTATGPREGQAAPPPVVSREVVAAGPPPPQIHAAPPAAQALQPAPRRAKAFASPAAPPPPAPQTAVPVSNPRPVVAAADKATHAAAPVDAATAHVARNPRPVIAAGGPGAQVLAAIGERKIGAQAQGQAGDQPYQPAASHTDSPSRGIPRAIHDPGKQITGGFGEAADAQYFPLDGAELLQVVWVLMDELAQRLKNDLRFSMAATYPRVAVKAQIVVEGYAEDQSFEVTKVMPPHDKTPIDVAQRHGDEVVFVIRTERREFTEDGEIASPPNAMRQEIGAVIPRKQWIGSGAGRQLADVAPKDL